MNELFRPNVEMRKVAEKGTELERRMIENIKRNLDERILAKSLEIGRWETLRRLRNQTHG